MTATSIVFFKSQNISFCFNFRFLLSFYSLMRLNSHENWDDKNPLWFSVICDFVQHIDEEKREKQNVALLYIIHYSSPWKLHLNPSLLAVWKRRDNKREKNNNLKITAQIDPRVSLKNLWCVWIHSWNTFCASWGISHRDLKKLQKQASPPTWRWVWFWTRCKIQVWWKEEEEDDQVERRRER